MGSGIIMQLTHHLHFEQAVTFYRKQLV